METGAAPTACIQQPSPLSMAARIHQPVRRATSTGGSALVATAMLVRSAHATGVNNMPFPPYDPVSGTWEQNKLDESTTRIDWKGGFENSYQFEGQYSGTLPTQIAFLTGLTVRWRGSCLNGSPQ